MVCNTPFLRKQGLIHMTLDSTDVLVLRKHNTQTCFLITTRTGTT